MILKRVLIMQKIKNNEINLLTSISCILVIFIHISSQAINELNKNSLELVVIYIPWRLSQFVVQCFIMLSAIKIYIKYKDTKFDFKIYIKFIINRIFNIFIPYIIWVMIYYIYFCHRDYFQFKFTDYIGYIIRGDLAAPFYFIIVIMQFYFLMPLWLYIVKKFSAYITIILSMLIMIFMLYKLPDLLKLLFNLDFKYNDRIFTSYILYWIMGCYIGKSYGKFKTLIKNYKILIITTFISLSLINIILSYTQFRGISIFTYLEFIHMLYCISVILFLYSLCIYLSDKKNIITSIMYNINKCSFYIYLSHCFVLNILEEQFELAQINDIGYMFIFKILFVYTIPLITSNIYIVIKRKIIDIVELFI